MDSNSAPEDKDRLQPSETPEHDDLAVRLKAIFDNVEEGILLLDAQGRVVEANRAYLAMHDAESLGQLRGNVDRLIRNFTVYDEHGREIPPPELPHHRAFKGEPVRAEIYRLVNNRTGRTVYGRYSMVPIYDSDGRLQWVIITISDITDIMRAARERERLLSKIVEQRAHLEDMSARLEMEVAAQTEQVRSLSRSLALLEHRERVQLSKLLHEDLQQILLATRMRLDLLAEDIPSEAARSDFIEASRLLHKAGRISRALALELNPPILESEGFDAALRWLADYLIERYDRPISITFPRPLGPLPREPGMIVLHTVRQVLVVALREFRFDDLSLTARQEDGLLIVEVEASTTDGTGDPDRWLRHLDWAPMREQLMLFGGNLTADTPEPGKIRIQLQLQLPADRRPRADDTGSGDRKNSPGSVT